MTKKNTKEKPSKDIIGEPDIYSIHLATGHILLGQVKMTNSKFITVDFPFAVTPVPKESGDVGYTLLEYMPYSLESRIRISKSSIVSVSPTSAKIKDIYVRFLARLLNNTVKEASASSTSEVKENHGHTIH